MKWLVLSGLVFGCTSQDPCFRLGKTDSDTPEQVVEGLAEACKLKHMPEKCEGSP